ncbi:MAG TPA: hypothetical protein VJI71_02255 [Candidatus Norongarragalinales archaeon]|nr:hypothetical protein [Candidatus Norongarragalinales archaeon]
MRKGFLAFSIAFLLVASVIVLAVIQKNSAKTFFDYSSRVLVLEKKHYLEMELKEAAAQVLRLSKGTGEKEVSENTARNLAKLEVFWEGKLSNGNIQADFWFGSVEVGEMEQILDETLSEKRPVVCGHCFDFSASTLDWDKKIVPKAIEVLFDRKVSAKGFSHTPSGVEWVGENVVLGATVFFPSENFAFVVLMEEGFG